MAEQESTVFVVDDDDAVRNSMRWLVESVGLPVETYASAREFLETHDPNRPGCLVPDVRMPGMSGLDLQEKLHENGIVIPIIVVTGHGDVPTAVRAIKAGAKEYVPLPPDPKLIAAVLEAVAEESHQMVFQDPAMKHVLALANQVAQSSASILVTGESGTGKELVARMIHEQGSRADGPFVPVNCGAIPAELMESEFFGHRKGSFTGAINNKTGLIQSADGGTLFLDEIADLPLAMQVKLLRVIQEKTVRPVGASSEEPANARILSATHKNLSQMVADGEFREDLYYRINVIELHVPALRDRGDDVVVLAKHILAKLDSTAVLDGSASGALAGYSFPGNVRELENMLERAVTLCTTGTIAEADLHMRETSGGINEPLLFTHTDLSNQVEDVQRQAIVDALERTRYNKTAAARLLGLSFRQLRYRIKKLGIE